MKKGFTLIELLVVIAIIAILAAILFPVFAQAREKARQTNCLSNCKQIGTALQLYVDDYDETLPFCSDSRISRWDGSKIPQAILDQYPGYPMTNLYFKLNDWAYANDCYTWADAIFPYVKNLNMFICPSGHAKSFGYGYNAMLCGGYNKCDAGATTFGAVTSLSQINKPSEVVFVSDTIQYRDNYWVCSLTAPVLVTEGHSSVTGNTFIKCARHNEGLNYTFCDGHAKYYKQFQGPGEKVSGGWGDNMKWWDPKVN